MYTVLRFIVFIFLKIFYRIKYYGVENIPKEGGVLLCSNHVTGMDMIYIGVKVNRLVHWMAKAELFKIPVLRTIIKWFGAYPVARGRGDIKAAKTTVDLLKSGKIVGIFPQGTRTYGKDISKIKAKHGAARFAIESGMPILPVGIEGGARPFSKVKIVFGKPYYLNVEEGVKCTREDYTRMSGEIMDNIYRMLEEVGK